jgi:hypothetical protein
MLFGTFFDVPNLMEVVGRFADLHRGFGYLASRPGKLASRSTTVGASHHRLSETRERVRTRFHGNLEEDIEAQEEQGIADRQRASMLRTDSTETASKMTTSREGEHQGGQGTG